MRSVSEAAATASYLTPRDSAWPAELDDLRETRPEGLWFRGNLATLAVLPRVAIVGTRRATAYGLRVTQALSAAFCRAGACVVSGLAHGIDGAAHRASLDCGGATIAVLGTGLNHSFPRGHSELQRVIGNRGLLLSELAPDEHGMRFTFPQRNRIIAALARVVIVVEAPAHSGALVTADHAVDLHRTVAAVPGPIDQPQSEGCNRLIAAGAGILASVEDALALAGLAPPARTPKADPEGDEGRVWTALRDGGLDIDALCQSTSLPAARCLAAVTNLELSGAIECLLTGEIRRR